uniref:Uncharacterized protein n=1 Tax=Sphaerodactylus townsendi TaxID=933632 RepID=A0ACB8FIY9_9SAUR
MLNIIALWSLIPVGATASTSLLQLLGCNHGPWSDGERMELEQFDFDIQKLLEPLEAEIQQGVNLKEEDFNKDMSEDNEGFVKELLQRGDALHQTITDERKREEIKTKQHLLQTKHNALKDLRSQRRKKALEISHHWYQYKRQADDLLKWLDDIEKKLANLPDPQDEQKLKEIDRELEKKKEELNAVQRQADCLSKDGAAKAVEPTLIQLSKRWRDIESKFAQFRRLNYAQIVSCSWQTCMFATTATNRILIAITVPSAIPIWLKQRLWSANRDYFVLQYNIEFVVHDLLWIASLN